jgi:HD-GYP domain-containing protein (c-di-GMP phosphodiesterase class II)
MTIPREKLKEELLRLAGENPEAASGNGLIDSIPDAQKSFNETIDKIVASFDHTILQNSRLTEEVLSCYMQINKAFSTTSSMYHCNTVQEAINTLITEIGQAVESDFAMFLGSTCPSYSLIEKEDPAGEQVAFYRFRPDDPSRPKSFYEEHKDALTEAVESPIDSQVLMLNYDEKGNHDHQGRGNVLIVNLSAVEPDEEKPGSLVFVRDNAQEPFLAVDMNLADILAKLGSVILGNIVYAQRIHKTYLQTISSLVLAMEAKDSYTGGHSNRVAEMACELGRRVGLKDNELKIMEWAGLLHDIGKIGIREDVLCKDGKLTPEEFDHIKTHPVKSFQVLEPIDALKCILGAVRHHHEHYDGKGYPDGLSGEDIPYYARILTVADIWDALTSTRSYRPAMSSEKARKILQEESGTTMDPELVKEFLVLLDEKNL